MRVEPIVGSSPNPILRTDLSWGALCFVVDNYSNQWLYVPAARRYVPPYVANAVFPVPSTQVVELQVQAPPSNFQAPPVSGEQYVITAYDQSQQLTSPTAINGVPQQISASGVTGLYATDNRTKDVGVVGFNYTTIVCDNYSKQYIQIGNGIFCPPYTKGYTVVFPTVLTNAGDQVVILPSSIAGNPCPPLDPNEYFVLFFYSNAFEVSGGTPLPKSSPQALAVDQTLTAGVTKDAGTLNLGDRITGFTISNGAGSGDIRVALGNGSLVESIYMFYGHIGLNQPIYVGLENGYEYVASSSSRQHILLTSSQALAIRMTVYRY